MPPLAPSPGAQRLVIFIDEIDAVRSLPFSTDEFFAAIRECYNRRSQDPAFEPLSFCLLGVASPSDLIRDTRMTPFNIGRRIELTDFTPPEAAPLAKGLGENEPLGRALLERVLYWTSGHPYLTQRLCQAVAQDETVTGPAGVDRLCEALLFSPSAREKDDNLLFVRERLLKSEADRASLLDLYAQVRAGKRVRVDDTNPLVDLLRLSGVARVVDGILRVRNRIYERVFDQEWVTTHMPDAELRRQRAAYRRGALRAAAIAGLVLAVMGALTVFAFSQRNQAHRQARLARAAQLEERAEHQRAARLLYGADMQLAARAWEDGATQRAGELLAAHRPKPGQSDFRGFDWRYQWRLLNPTTATFTEHGGAVLAGAFAPDGRLITVDEDLQLRHWDADRRHPARVVNLASHGDRYSPALSPDGRLVALRTHGGDIELRNTTAGRLVRVLKGHGMGAAPAYTDDARFAAVTLAFSLDSQRLVSVGEFDRTARVWEVATGREIHRINQLGKAPDARWLVRCPALSPDGRTLALGDSTEALATGLYDLRKSEASNSLLGELFQGGTVWWVAYSPDGKILATTHYGRGILFWDPTTRKEIRALDTHTSDLLRLAFSPDGRTLATGSADSRVKLWDVASGRELRTLQGHAAPITFVAFSADGKRLASGSRDGVAKLWDLTHTEETPAHKEHANHINSVTYSPDGRRLVTVSWDRAIKLWDPQTEKVVRSLPSQSWAVTAAAFSPDSRTLVTGGWDNSLVKFWDPATGRQKDEFVGLPPSFRPWYGRPVASLAFSPNGRWLAGGFGHPGGQYPDYDAVVKVWDLSNRKGRILRGHANTVMSVLFSPDSRTLVSGSQDGTVRLWQAGTWKPIDTLTGFEGRVSAIALASDGQTLAVGSGSGEIQLRRLSSPPTAGPPAPPLILKGHVAGIRKLAFSPDGRTLASASGDRSLKLWDTVSGRETRTLRHPAAVDAVMFSPDGNTLATGDTPGAVRFWRAASPQEIAAGSAADPTAGSSTAARPPSSSPAAALNWRQRAAADALQKKQWAVALAHLDQLVQADPARWRDRLDRAR